MRTANLRIGYWILPALFSVFGSSTAWAQSVPVVVENESMTDGEAREKAAEWLFWQRAYPLSTIPKQYRFEALNYMKREWGYEWKSRKALETTPGDRWVEIGPDNIGGRIRAIALHPNDDNTLYVGGADGGVFKSTDSGQTWVALNDTLPSLAIMSLVLDPKNPDIVYAGTGEGTFNTDAAIGKGVMKSTDAGANWTFSSAFSSYVNRLVVHPDNTNVLFAAARDGVFKSTDAGATWNSVMRAHNCIDLSIDPTNPQVLLTSVWDRNTDQTQNGIWRSIDGGASWSRVEKGLPAGSLIGRVALARAPSQPQILYAGVSNITSANPVMGIFKSDNGGESWSQLAGTPAYCGSQCWYDNELTVHPNDPATLFGGGILLWKSSDSGISWARSDAGVHVDHHAMAISRRNPNIIYEGNDGGMYRSSDGGTTWKQINQGLNITQFYAMAMSATDPSISYGGTQDNGSFKASGSSSFQMVVGGDGMVPLVDYTNPNFVYCETQRGGLRRSTNGGISFSDARTGINTSDRFNWVTPWIIDPVNPQVLYVGSHRLYKSTNRAVSWTAVSADLTTGGSSSYLSSIAVAPSDTNMIYIGTSDGQLWTSIDGAATVSSFQRINRGLPNRYVTRLRVHPTQSRTVYVTFSGFNSAGGMKGHVFKSTDGGESWQDISSNLPDLPVQVIVLDPRNPQILFLGTDLGCFRSLNDGASWEPFNDGLPNVVVDDMAFFGNTDFLRAATHGRGMWQYVTSGRQPAHLIKISGDNQKAAAAADLVFPTRVAVLDTNFVPVPNAEISFEAPTTGPGGTFAGGATLTTTMTDMNGVANLPPLRLNGTAGPFNISASGPGITDRVSISLESVTSAPQLVRVEPDSAAMGQWLFNDSGGGWVGGQIILLTGSDFAPSFTVYFVQKGSWYATTTYTVRLDPSHILALIPSGLSPGPAKITVNCNGAFSAGIDINITNEPTAPIFRELLPAAPSPGQQFLASLSGLQYGTEQFTLVQDAARFSGRSKFTYIGNYAAAGFDMPSFPFRIGPAQIEFKNNNGPLSPAFRFSIPEQPLPPELIAPSGNRAPEQLVSLGSNYTGFAFVPQFNAAIFSQGSDRFVVPAIAFSSSAFGSLVAQIPSGMSAGQAEVQVQSEFANGIALSNPVSLNIGSAPSITAPTISPSPLVRGGQATVTSTSIGAFNSDPVRNRVVIRTGGSEYPAQIDGIGLLGNVLAFTVPTDVPLGSATVQVIAAFGSQNITRVSGASMTIIDARKVTIVSGDRQTTDAGQPFAEPLAVRVTQADGSPVANAGVMFTAPAQGTSGFFENGGGTSTTVTTNSAGLATASVFKSNRSGGRFYVRASLTGQPNAAIFSLQIRNAVSNRQPRMPAHGAATAETAGIENSASIGYLNLTGFESPLAGISIFRLRDAAGNLVSEAAVPAAVPATSGLFFVDTRAGADTAVALVNPGSEEASITLRLRDSSGTPVGDPATIKLPSKAQTALFLSGVFGNNASNFLGTASLESTQPVGGVSLRAVVNNRGETIYSALPVAQAAAAGITGGELGFPHLAIGGGYRSVIILLNPGTARLTGKLRLHDNQGAALALPGGVQALDYSIPPGGHFLFDSASMAIDKAVSGYAVVAADSGNALPVGTLLFSGFSGNLLISEAAVPASRHLRRALLFVDQQSTELRNAAETLITGVAIANRGSNSAKVRFILRNMLGSVVGIPRTIEIPARGQTARFVHELMGSAAFEMQGSLEVVSDQSIELLTLRGTYNAQGEFLFTTLPVADYAAESKGALLFAHFADGGGYSTQTVVLNPSDAAGQITLRYLSSTGTPRLVDVK